MNAPERTPLSEKLQALADSLDLYAFSINDNLGGACEEIEAIVPEVAALEQERDGWRALADETGDLTSKAHAVIRAELKARAEVERLRAAIRGVLPRLPEFQQDLWAKRHPCVRALTKPEGEE